MKFFKSYHSSINEVILDPWFIIGLTDAEGCFQVSVVKNNEYKLGWQSRVKFKITLGSKDLPLLLKIQQFFGGIGSIQNNKNGITDFIVTDLKEIITIIIPFFTNHPLLTQKSADFLLFEMAANLINSKAHLTLEGLYKIVEIKASNNTGLNANLKKAFPNIKGIIRSSVNISNIPSGEWVAGFVSGDGSFDIQIPKSKAKTGIGYKVQMRFRLTQHIKDKDLFILLIKYFNCGRIEYYKSNLAINLTVTDFNNIYSLIIPFFNKYNIRGVKALDFHDFCLVADLISKKLHLTETGLKEIQLIKSRMNSFRFKGQ